jgi:hypothetical protein
MEEDYPGFDDLFSAEEVYKLLALVNETISGVHYHFWVNKSQGQHFEVLDWIELQFSSGNKLFLTAGIETDGIKLGAPDFDLIRANLRDEFKGVVTLESRNVSAHEIWSENLAKAITPSLFKHEKGMLNDSIVLKFENGSDIEIRLGLDGLEVGYFEGDGVDY